MKLPLRAMLTLGCLSLASAFAYARIGETEKQCEERYGKPIQRDKEDSIRVYRKGEFVVAAEFHRGKCDLIIFQKRPDDGLGSPVEISERERSVLLKANGGDREWRKMAMVGETIVFETEDKEFQAEHRTMTHYLFIMNREGKKRKTEAVEAREKNKMKGF